MNDTGLNNNDRPKLFNYNTYATNKDNRQHGGTAIAVKKTIQTKLHDDFETDLIAVTIETRQGPITIATDYIPPNPAYLNYLDYYKLLKRPHPVYLLRRPLTIDVLT